jgi:hypothetical protein
MSTMVERLLDVTRTLPEPLLTQVVDFAEFLQSRRQHEPVSATDIGLAQLSGGLEKSNFFVGSPLDIQRHLRDEWH